MHVCLAVFVLTAHQHDTEFEGYILLHLFLDNSGGSNSSNECDVFKDRIIMGQHDLLSF